MTKEERKMRIIARGEHSGHSHIVTGENITITKKGKKTFIEVGEDSNAVLQHLLEAAFIETGEEIWTQEHLPIPLKPGKYEYIPQVEFDPYGKEIMRKVAD